ncbi:MAG: V-type ATP synthase subunit D [Bacteroidales bacterium]|nr:V-type ATP synthase subunit D [Bacteroidales bacterium]
MFDLVLGFVQANVKYVDDAESEPIGKVEEYFRYASETLVDREGDCDCKSVLAYRLFEKLGVDVDLVTVKVAGVKTPAVKEIHYDIAPFNAFVKPAWFADGVAILKELSRLGIESEVLLEKSRILEYQRKKTTQKVNLYEKVQIPGFKEAIRKIKRYMEDEENLSKASSKIVKGRHAAEEEMEEQQ